MAEAELRKNNEYSPGKHRFALFNRSFTLNTNPVESFQRHRHVDRTDTTKKSYNPFDSFKSAGHSLKGKVKKLRNLFDSPRGSSKKRADDSKSPSSSSQSPLSTSSPTRFKLGKSIGSDYWSSVFNKKTAIKLPPGSEDRIVVYFTSLRGIRRTYEDCYAVRMIFKGFRVWVDERDVYMDYSYKKELQSVLGEKDVSLPQIFIKGKYVGDAEVVRNLFETGELAKILEGFPKTKPGYVCRSCGDMRFVLCMTCSGSRKIFDEGEGILKRCLECNENGLMHCPDCGNFKSKSNVAASLRI